MKQPATLIFGILFALSGCGGPESDPANSSKLHTIEQEHVARGIAQEDTAATTEADAVSLPFAPPISMDPVDGSKVSIRTTTPSTEYGGKIYHFSSEENLKLFVENPKKYLSGSLAAY